MDDVLHGLQLVHGGELSLSLGLQTQAQLVVNCDSGNPLGCAYVNTICN